MGAQVIFSVQGLTEKEMWILLREKTCNFINSSDLYPLAKCVVEKCGGLPLAITFAARMLKEMNKFWPRFVAEANYARSLSYVDMLKEDIINISFPNSLVEIKAKVIEVLKLSVVFGMINHHLFSVFSVKEFLPQKLVELDLRDTDIQVLPMEMKKLKNVRLLNLTNCRHLQIIEAGAISSLVCLEELYMLVSLSEWEVEREGKKVGNASISELEFLLKLTAVQIVVQSPNIIPESLRIWTRSIVTTSQQLKCRVQESLDLSFVALNLKSVHISYCPKLQSLFPFGCSINKLEVVEIVSCDALRNLFSRSTAEAFVQLEHVIIEHCFMMEEFVAEDGEKGQEKIKESLFPKLKTLELRRLCSRVSIA